MCRDRSQVNFDVREIVNGFILTDRFGREHFYKTPEALKSAVPIHVEQGLADVRAERAQVEEERQRYEAERKQRFDFVVGDKWSRPGDIRERNITNDIRDDSRFGDGA